MREELPLTRKEDTLSHGYGTLSMNIVFINHGNNVITEDSSLLSTPRMENTNP